MQDGISTHALTEGDDHRSFRTPGRSHFNSRPHGGRPEETLKAAAVATISTHALTEGDVFSSVKSMHAFNFNSRPHGGRLLPIWPSDISRNISTHALTEGDFQEGDVALSERISTHALTEGDVAGPEESYRYWVFQLTPSRRAT